jgi:hypothetical protein
VGIAMLLNAVLELGEMTRRNILQEYFSPHGMYEIEDENV